LKTQIQISLLSLLSLIVISSVWARPRFFPEALSCKSRPEVVGKCFNVHGRLSVYNGTPSIRLWPMGTKRLLGVIDPNDVSNAPGPTILPVDIKTKLDWDKDVFGDFIVCPLTRQQPRRMQTVCIASGKNLVVREHKLTAR
jgi:hypothetical protein